MEHSLSVNLWVLKYEAVGAKLEYKSRIRLSTKQLLSFTEMIVLDTNA